MCLMLALVVILCIPIFTACDNGVVSVATAAEDSEEFTLPEGARPTLASRLTDEDRRIIDLGASGNATAEQLRTAVIRAYDVANNSRMQSNTSLMVQESIMGINPGGVNANTTMDDVMGTVLMHGFTLSAGDVWFNQFAATVNSIKGNIGFMGTIMNAMGSEMVKQSYHTADDEYYFVIIKGDEAEVDCEIDRFPYAYYRLTQEPQKYEYDEFLEVTHTLNAPGEIYNMDFVADIIADNATIEYVEDGGYWDIHFEVNMSADPELIENWYRLPQKDMKEGGQTINQYFYYRSNFQLWDNGYVKSYYAEYARDAGMGSSITMDNYKYLWNEDEIMDIVSDDYRLDDMSEFDRQTMLGSLSDYVEYYSDAEIVEARASKTMIILICVGVAVGIVVLAIIALIIFAIVRKVRIKQGRWKTNGQSGRSYGFGGDDSDFEL